MSEFPVQFRKVISVNATKRRQYMSLNVQAQGEGVYAFCPLSSSLSSPSLALLPSPFPPVFSYLLSFTFLHLPSPFLLSPLPPSTPFSLTFPSSPFLLSLSPPLFSPPLSSIFYVQRTHLPSSQRMRCPMLST